MIVVLSLEAKILNVDFYNMNIALKGMLPRLC